MSAVENWMQTTRIHPVRQICFLFVDRTNLVSALPGSCSAPRPLTIYHTRGALEWKLEKNAEFNNYIFGAVEMKSVTQRYPT
jgi:hypothetical protein